MSGLFVGAVLAVLLVPSLLDDLAPYRI